MPEFHDEQAQKVEQVFNRVKAGDRGAINDLSVEASLPYLAKYITDADPTVREMLMRLVQQSQLPQALSIRTALVKAGDRGAVPEFHDEQAQKVEQVFNRVKAGDRGAIDDLDINASLPYLAQYITDANKYVRMMLVPLARQSQSPEALSILTALVVDRDGNVFSKAVQAISSKYSEERIVTWGGVQLCDNLLRYVERDISTAEALLLLAMLPAKEGEQEQLIKVARRSQQEKTRCQFGGDPVQAPIAIDLVLAQLGNRDAGKRTLDRIISGNSRVDVAFIAVNARILDDPALLLALVDRLDDKRTAVILVYPGQPRNPNEKKPTDSTAGMGAWLRICDAVLEQLAIKTGIDVGVDVAARSKTFTMPRYSDTELTEARRRLHAHFALR